VSVGEPTAARATTPPHRQALLWMTVAALVFAAIQLGWRVWLIHAGEPAVGVVVVATDTCVHRHRGNCFLGRALVDPQIPGHRGKRTKIRGGRFHTVGERVPMRVYPHDRMYIAVVDTPLDWLLGPLRSLAVALIWLFAALMPAHRMALWIVPCVVSLFLLFG
jgi:hypothetical protein